MRKILLLTYYWPPCGGPGSLRPVKFAKYLPDYGFEPIILTRKDIAYHSPDQELGKDLKGLRIYRTESFDPARILYLIGKHQYKPHKWERPIKSILNFPDNKIGWIPFAYNAGLKISFDFIFVTAPPFSAFITGYLIKKKTKRPLILDFRDAWLEFPFMPYKIYLQKRFVSYWEGKVTQIADLIIVVNENIRKALVNRFPQLEEKIFVIPNGYDPDDFPSVPSPEKFTLVYLGTIRRERNPEVILRALDNFIKERKIPEETIEMKFIGYVDREFLDLMKSYSFVRILGYLPYSRAIGEFCSAHLAVLITTGDDFFFPSRQIEYLASGLPIICCGSSAGIGILKEAFQKGYPGWVYNYGDLKGIKERISEIYARYKSGTIKRAENPFLKYTRKNLTEQLVGLIEKRIPGR